VVQKILSVLEEAEDPEINDYFENFMKDLPVHYDPESDEAIKELENEDLLLDIDSDDEDSDKDLFENTEPVDGEGEKLSALKKVCDCSLFLICFLNEITVASHCHQNLLISSAAPDLSKHCYKILQGREDSRNRISCRKPHGHPRCENTLELYPRHDQACSCSPKSKYSALGMSLTLFPFLIFVLC
jgi:hypothetical protein